MYKPLTGPALGALLLCSFALQQGCAKEPLEEEEIERASNWVEDTHGQSATPDYELLFDTSQVHTLHITIDGGDFSEMTADLEALVGDDDDVSDEDPMYVPVTITHDGATWEHVGMRYKGNAALADALEDGNGKYPFRLNFDYWEDQYPEIKNQRFYGFDKLIFSSGSQDPSNLREVLASEILRGHGVPTAQAAFYRVVVDTGQGDTYWGLYTMLEEPSDDAMLTQAFGSAEGNMYKPSGDGADWTAFVEEGFEKKSHEAAMDYSDVEGAIAALHAGGDAQTWRDNLEARFNVTSFLRWLAINTAMQNWDAYGNKARNYYLYGDPYDNGRLYWVPWDHDRALSAARDNGAGLMHEGVGEDWPLISLLLADEEYRAQYRAFLAEVQDGPMEVEAFSARARELHDMIAPHMIGEQGESSTHTSVTSREEFEASAEALITHVEGRQAALRQELGEVQ
jgi:spore coat protein CotH